MKNVLEALKKATGRYQGEGINHEGQPFTGRLILQPILDGRGFSISFSANGVDGTLYHKEESTIAPAIHETLTLWNFNTNTPGLVAHDLRATQSKSGALHSFVFGFNQPADTQTFREEVAIDLWENGDLSYTYSWGLPGGEFKERSGVRMSRLSASAKFPGVGVGVLVERDGKILMLRRKHVHGSGTWSTPGGHLEFGEDPAICGVREVREETGIAVKNLKFLEVTNDVFPEHGKHSVTIWYKGEYDSGTECVGDKSEMDQVGWYPKDALPQPLFLPLQNLLASRKRE